MIKKIKYIRWPLSIALAAFIAVLVVGVGSGQVIAKTTQNRNVSLAANQSYDGTFIRAAENIDISGTINGDVFVFGSSLTISGKVEGNVYALVQTISVNGEIVGNLHTAANSVNLAGKVGGGMIAAASTVSFANNSSIGRGLMAAASKLDINGSVSQQAYVAGSTVNINSKINSDVTAAASQLNVNSDAKIEGNLRYYSNNDANISSSAKINGEVSKQQPARKSNTAEFMLRISNVAFMILSGFLVLLAMLFIAPSSVISVTKELHNKPLRSFGFGLAFLILVPIVIVLGFVTAIAIPLAILLLLFYIAALIVSGGFVALWLGRLLLRTKNNDLTRNLVASLAGLTIIGVISLLPIVGTVIIFASFIVGLGALVSRFVQRLQSLRIRQTKQAK